MLKSDIAKQMSDWVFPFGKYRGEKIIDVWQIDKKYCEWLYETLDEDNQTRLAIKLLCPNIGNTIQEDNIDTAKVLDIQKRLKNEKNI